MHTSPLVFVGRLLSLLFALALMWYGLMTLLLALKVSPSTLNSISGYRSAFNWFARLTPHQVGSEPARAIIAGAGIVAFLLFGYLALKEFPQPHLARHDLQLTDDNLGGITVKPRALERIVEIAATQHPAVSGASGRYSGEDLTLAITVRRPRDLAGTLREVQRRAAQAVERHQLPTLPINVTLSGYDRRDRRELH